MAAARPRHLSPTRGFAPRPTWLARALTLAAHFAATEPLRALCGEGLNALNREPGVTAGAITQWREWFLASGQAGLKSRPADERDDELGPLRARSAS